MTQELNTAYAQVIAINTYDDSMARRIYGGSDMILIPSRYEPCGLTQMIGMRYGCVPIARSTGGLKDTIIDYHSKGKEHSTGFLFERADSQALSKTMQRALDVYRDQRRWAGLQRRGMKMDFSWEKSAMDYLDLYRELHELELKIAD
jgi:starch synthase